MASPLAPTQSRGDGENCLQHRRIVNNAKLVWEGQQECVCLHDGLILLELLDQHIRLRRIGPAKDPSGAINIAEMISVLLLTTEIGTIAVVYERKDAAADGNTRSPGMTGLFQAARKARI
jgi:hypothetical protein